MTDERYEQLMQYRNRLMELRYEIERARDETLTLGALGIMDGVGAPFFDSAMQRWTRLEQEQETILAEIPRLQDNATLVKLFGEVAENGLRNNIPGVNGETSVMYSVERSPVGRINVPVPVETPQVWRGEPILPYADVSYKTIELYQYHINGEYVQIGYDAETDTLYTDATP